MGVGLDEKSAKIVDKSAEAHFISPVALDEVQHPTPHRPLVLIHLISLPPICLSDKAMLV